MNRCLVLAVLLMQPSLPLSASPTSVRLTTAQGAGREAAVRTSPARTPESFRPSFRIAGSARHPQGDAIYLEFDLRGQAFHRWPGARFTAVVVSGADENIPIEILGLPDRFRAATARVPAGSLSAELIPRLDRESWVSLGTVWARPGPGTLRLQNEALRQFCHDDRDGRLGLLLRIDAASASSIELAGHAHPWFSPPTLWLTADPLPDEIAAARWLIGFPLAVEGLAGDTFETLYYQLERRARRSTWSEVVPEAERVRDAVRGRAAEPSSTSLPAALAEMMLAETRLKASQLDTAAWARRVASVLRDHPDEADVLLHSLIRLAGSRVQPPPEPSVRPLDLRPLRAEPLPPLARATIRRFETQVLDPSAHDEAIASFENGFTPGQGGTTDPDALDAYVRRLRASEGRTAARVFLDRLLGLELDLGLRRAALLLRWNVEPTRAHRRGWLAEQGADRRAQLPAALRLHGLAGPARRGQLGESLDAPDRSPLPDDVGLLIHRAEALLMRLETDTLEATSTAIFSRSVSHRRGIHAPPTAQELGADQAWGLYEQGRYLASAAAAWVWLERYGKPLPRLDATGGGDDWSTLLDPDDPVNRRAGAAGLLMRVAEFLPRPGVAEAWRRETQALPARGTTAGTVHLVHALSAMERGRSERARVHLAQARRYLGDHEILDQFDALLAPTPVRQVDE
jgi:hypothetical protein